MSRRITTETELTDLEMVKEACQMAGFRIKDLDGVVHFTSGPLLNASLDTNTGSFQYDEDFRGAVNTLKMNYAEGLLRKEIHKQGGRVESRGVNKKGEIELIYQIG